MGRNGTKRRGSRKRAPKLSLGASIQSKGCPSECSLCMKTNQAAGRGLAPTASGRLRPKASSERRSTSRSVARHMRSLRGKDAPFIGASSATAGAAAAACHKPQGTRRRSHSLVTGLGLQPRHGSRIQLSAYPACLPGTTAIAGPGVGCIPGALRDLGAAGLGAVARVGGGGGASSSGGSGSSWACCRWKKQNQGTGSGGRSQRGTGIRG